MNDLNFFETDFEVLTATLDACGLIKEWEMTRCRCGDGLNMLLEALGRQPLCRLALGYNALGMQGISSFVAAAAKSRWSNSLSASALQELDVDEFRSCLVEIFTGF